jgi:hypothetical protein
MTESNELFKRLHEINDDFPDTPMSEESRQFLRQSPLDFVASRSRSLKAALRSGDEKQIDLLVDDISHVVGKRNAEFWKITMMGRMVEAEMNEGMEIYPDDLSNLEE